MRYSTICTHVFHWFFFIPLWTNHPFRSSFEKKKTNHFPSLYIDATISMFFSSPSFFTHLCAWCANQPDSMVTLESIQTIRFVLWKQLKVDQLCYRVNWQRRSDTMSSGHIMVSLSHSFHILFFFVNFLCFWFRLVQSQLIYGY